MATGYELNRDKGEIAGQPPVSRSLWQTLFAWALPHCPECKGAMTFRYQMPDDYREVSPKYYECPRCAKGFCRAVGGPWTEVPLDEIPRS